MKMHYIVFSMLGLLSFGVFTKCRNDERERQEKEKKQTSSVNLIKREAARTQAEEIDRISKVIDSQIEMTKFMRESEAMVEESKRNAEAQRLKNIESIRRAQIQIRILKGEKIENE